MSAEQVQGEQPTKHYTEEVAVSLAMLSMANMGAAHSMSELLRIKLRQEHGQSLATAALNAEVGESSKVPAENYGTDQSTPTTAVSTEQPPARPVKSSARPAVLQGHRVSRSSKRSTPTNNTVRSR